MDGLFKLEQLQNRPYEKDDDVWVSVTIERSLTMIAFERQVYTMFDFLSDVGGLSGIFVSGLMLFVRAWTYNRFDNFMVSNLFKMKKPDNLLQDKQNPPEIFVLSNLPNCRDLIRHSLPRCCR